MSRHAPSSPVTVLFDVDGTLVDSNDAHAHAWVAAFADHGVTVEFAHVRRCIGMGGDKLMPAVSGIQETSARGAAISRRRGEIFKQQFLPHLEPFRDADRLVLAVTHRGHAAVAASSAQADELHALLAIAGAASLMNAATSSDDADESKPAPDIIQAAMRRAGTSPERVVMIGDTPYDLEAAQRAGIAMIAFRCGGWDDPSLRGAIAIYDGPWDLCARIDESPLRGAPK